MLTSLKAGVAYFAMVFALGFILGSARVLLLAPALGEVPATLLELPIMLVASWYSCRWLVAKFQVSRAVMARLAMGALAFVLLIGAETLLGLGMMDRTIASQFAQYRQTGPLLGLIAQIAFAAFPTAQSLAES